MENLPVEIITHILKYLPSIKDRKSCSLVNRLWYDAYQDPFFRNYEVLHITTDNKFQILASLTNVNRKFFHIHIKDAEITENSIKFWKRFGPYIKTLSLSSCNIREKVFITMLKACEQLELLSIQNCRELFMVGHLLNDVNERLILKEQLSSLNTLNLSYNRYLSDAIFDRFAWVVPKIKNLLLSGCQISFFSGLYKKYYPDGAKTPSESVLTFPIILNYMKHNAKDLKYLSFSDTFIDNAAIRHISQIQELQLSSLNLRGCFQLSHEGILLLVNHQKSLTELDISLCPRVTDGSLLAICAGLTNLTTLSVQRCRAITDLGITNLSQLEKLKYLNISECDLIEEEGIIKGLCHKLNPNIRELRLNHLGNMTDNAVICLSKSLPSLRILDLGFCYNAVTDKSVQSILKNNCHLQTLILTMCEKLTDSGLTGLGSWVSKAVPELLKIHLGSMAELGIVREAKCELEMQEIFQSPESSGVSLKNLKKLQTLNLAGCNGISDFSLKHAFDLHDLRYLNLSRCNRITEDGLRYLCNNKALEYLNLDQCHNIGNDGILYILDNLKHLDSLVVGSTKVTDSIALLLSAYGKKLVHLDIRQCHVSLNAINDILRNLPCLQDFQYTSPRFADAEIPLTPQRMGFRLNSK